MGRKIVNVLIVLNQRSVNDLIFYFKLVLTRSLRIEDRTYNLITLDFF